MAELIVVATPIGNLSDMSLRMGEALSMCDLIAAEDTRVTMKLLTHLGIKKPMISCHRHNEAQKADGLIERMMREDLIVCLTCDAGTPGISDPGVDLVHAAIDAGIKVTPICGPSAVTAHLSVCGFDAREFAFYGFLPRESKPIREKLLSVWRSDIKVSVFYESPHRVVKLTEHILAVCPDARVSVACDISKKFECIVTGSVQTVLDALKANPNVEKGEYSIAVQWPKAPAQEKSDLPADAQMLTWMLQGMTLNDAASLAAQRGFARNEIYKAKLSIKAFLESTEG